MRAFALVFLSGCALVSGLSEVKVSDAIEGGTVEEASSIDSAIPCPQSCGTVPDGWQAVTRPKDPTRSCGARPTVDFTTGLANPNAACPCGCAVATMPSCVAADHPIQSGDQCTVQGTYQATGKCTPAQSGMLASSYKTTAIPSSGGACSTPSTTPAPAPKIAVRTCGVAQGCSGAPCATVDEAACVVKQGMATCPADYPMSTTVGTDVSVSCSCTGSCMLKVSCDNPALHFYSDMQCTTEIAKIDANGGCNSSGNAGKPFSSYEYTATINAACTGLTMGSAKVDLVGATTICCKP